MQGKKAGSVRFAAAKLLTPGEQDVLRRFCSGLGMLPRLPRQVAVFGSRARGDADEYSDLDVAVWFDGGRDPSIERALSALAQEARQAYVSGKYGIWLRPVALFGDERRVGPLAGAIAAEGQVIWRRR